MDLFEELNQENNKYISISDAFRLLAEQTKNDLPNISKYLLLKKFHYTAQTFLKNYLDKIITIDHQENNDSWHITYDILENFLGENKFLGNASNRYTEADIENYCWLKSDFFEFEAIKKSGITDINNITATQDLNIGNSTITSTEPHVQNLIDKIEVLKNIIQEKNAKIEELTQVINAIQNNNNIDQLHTKTKNNVAKLILVLSDMANIDISKPYAVYDAINTKAQLLGIDRFPNDDTVAGWLKTARKYKETDS